MVADKKLASTWVIRFSDLQVSICNVKDFSEDVVQIYRSSGARASVKAYSDMVGAYTGDNR